MTSLVEKDETGRVFRSQFSEKGKKNAFFWKIFATTPHAFTLSKSHKILIFLFVSFQIKIVLLPRFWIKIENNKQQHNESN